MRKSTIIKRLKERFPDIDGIKCGEDWGAGKNSIHLGNVAEGGTIDGLPACDFYGGFHDQQEKIYVMGVQRKLSDALDEFGYFAECHDPGTYIAYPA